jgi:Fe-S oxidoreductase
MSSGTAQALGRIAQAPFVRDGHLHGLPLLGDQLSWRSLPALSPTPFRKRPVLAEPAPPLIAGSRAAGMRVAYFPACITELFEPETGEAAVRVLRALGCAVSIPPGWTCCGLVAANAGDRARAGRLLKQTITALEAEPEATIVSTSTSCVVMLTQDAPYLLRDEPEWRARAEALATRIRDFTHFVHDVARLPAGALARVPAGPDGEPALVAGPVTYHDACQSANCLGLGPEARRVLREVCGIEVREMAESNVCCGFGGTFSVEHPQVARRILARKLEHIEATGAPVVVTDNPGCLMHLRGGLRAGGHSVQARHLAEILAARLPRTGLTASGTS